MLVFGVMLSFSQTIEPVKDCHAIACEFVDFVEEGSSGELDPEVIDAVYNDAFRACEEA